MGSRSPCCDKSHVKKESWTAEEDEKILAHVANHGIGNRILVPQIAGLKHDSFTPQEEELILSYHKAIGSRWSLIAKKLPGRTDNDVKNHWNTKLKKKLIKMGRLPPSCDKSHVKKGSWRADEDGKLLAYVASHGTGNWTLVPQKAGLNRSGQSCRRWTNYLRPDLKHDSFTPQEEELILSYHKAIGSRWSLMAKKLPGRTHNDVKNHWNAKLKKDLIKMGIDPISHKPLGQH